MASGGDYAHAVVTARVGGDETGGQGAILEETAGGVRVLWCCSHSGGGGGDLLGSICPELGVAPLVDPGTDCEDELPTSAGPPADVDQ